MRSTSSPAMRPASRVACRCESSKYAGTVMTAFVGLPARWRTSLRIIAESSSGVYSWPAMLTCSTFRPPAVSRSTIWCGMSFEFLLQVGERAAHEPLDAEDGVLGVGQRRVRGPRVPTRTVPSSWKLMTAGHERDAVRIADDDRPAVLDVRREAEGGAQIDADDGGGGHGVRGSTWKNERWR